MAYTVTTVEQDSTELLSQLFTGEDGYWWDEPRLDSCMHQVFERQVERTPTATAVVFGEEKVSYEELNQRANQLAHYLRDRGVCADMPVGICLERSVEMIVGILGVLKAGGGYMPLDPDSVILAQLTATAEEQRAVADTRELLKRRGDAATIGTQPAKADTRRPKSSSRRKRPGGDESDLVE